MEALASAVRQFTGTKWIQIGKEEVKHSLFAHDMIPYVEKPKDSTKTIVRTDKWIQ